ncbi:MAG: acyl-CoA dehydratase activase-related protein, partial [Desulfosarcinaceae bacterium]
GLDRLFNTHNRQFNLLPPLSDFETSVVFKTMRRGSVAPGDTCLLGLDVGSTTTKAVLLRLEDNSLLASIYLRTSGDPVEASRRCYRSILEQIKTRTDPARINIVGLGVCGSGRQIAGLHALTEGVINEIVAHAVAAVYFDPEVDTLFEIGGQDAKYPYITNGVPSDYAMNEACSAGTGSFLEESALETLGVPMENIAATALKGGQPPNFNDQCAAFIASDIKNAIHEGVAHEDIVAGLVYSICMNYSNRVKGNRPVGRKVFMQGGVCYNKAVPLAMAALTGKPIIVPPEPGLMGAFGAALEVKKRLAGGLMQPDRFDLAALADRQVAYGKPFICRGGKEGCDRRCEIARIRIEGKTYPFGGACNRYDNLRRNQAFDAARHDWVRVRQQLIFDKYAPAPLDPNAPGFRGRIGLNRSFLVNTYYPLYAHFFSSLGYEPLLPGQADQAGIDQRNAPFCYPGELAHGFFHNLLHSENPPDHLFLPHFKALPSLNGTEYAQVCPLVQAETFYLRTTFRRQISQLQGRGMKIFTPLLDLSQGLAHAREALVQTAVRMGLSIKKANKAFDRALAVMEDCLEEMQILGRRALEALASKPDQMAVVLFGRPYNAYVEEAHMGIPHKLATRGITVIPLDFLPLEDYPAKRQMYWGIGQRITKAARLVAEHPQLFGTYITNFSCGPDSFLVGYFRDIMGRKPSLTLELDSHTADAGLETRIEAFIDIVRAYRQLQSAPKQADRPSVDFTPAHTVVENKTFSVVTSQGETLPYNDPRVTLLIPSMGALGTQAIAAAFSSAGFNTYAHEPGDEAILKLGRGNTSCKECLPLILTTGILLNYLEHIRRPGEVVLYFMPTGSGPCRFGQYHIFMEDLIRKRRIADAAIFSLTSDDGYDGVPGDIQRRAWWGVVVSDVLEDMRAMLLANAEQTDLAKTVFQDQLNEVIKALGTGDFDILIHTLEKTAHRLGQIKLKKAVSQVPLVSLTGEIYVRRDNLSRQHLTEYLAEKGFAAICAPVAEWIIYSDYVVNKGLSEFRHKGWRNKLRAHLKVHFMHKDETRIKAALARCGLVHAEPIEIEKILKTAEPFISPYLGGEAILTIGGSMREVAVATCGVIAIGPFGCMPNRVSEAILNETMKREYKLAGEPDNPGLKATLGDIDDLPFLAIESDGSPFPQLIHAKLEAFCLRALRMHEKMVANRYAN